VSGEKFLRDFAQLCQHTCSPPSSRLAHFLNFSCPLFLPPQLFPPFSHTWHDLSWLGAHPPLLPHPSSAPAGFRAGCWQLPAPGGSVPIPTLRCAGCQLALLSSSHPAAALRWWCWPTSAAGQSQGL